jgi:glycosyltransferase involved in cell wall biosynthesis
MKTPLKLALLLPGLWRGGAERRAAFLAGAMRQRGHEAEVFVLQAPEPGDRSFLPEFAEAGVPVRDLGYGGVRWPPAWPRTFRAFARLRRELKRFRPDVLHAFLPSGNIFAAGTLATLMPSSRPALLFSREGLPTYRQTRPSLGWMEDFASRRADATVCVCRAIALAVEQAPRGSWHRELRVILNGVEADRFARSPEAKTQARTDLEARFPPLKVASRVAVVVANLIPYKGHADILDALAKLQASGRAEGLAFVFVGGDPLGWRAELERRVEALSLRERVFFAGGVEDARPWLWGADLCVSASHEEGLSLAILEAMSAGLPVVASEVGGTPEILDDSFALSFPAKNPDALADALAQALAWPEDDWRRRGEAAIALCQEKFSARRMADETEALYRELAERRNKGRV